jgi:hypothetical protein
MNEVPAKAPQHLAPLGIRPPPGAVSFHLCAESILRLTHCERNRKSEQDAKMVQFI